MDRKHPRRWIGGLGISLLVAGGLLAAGCSSSASSGPAASSTATTVHYFSLSSSSNLYGTNNAPITNPNAAPAVGDYLDSTGTDYSGNHSSHSSTVSATDHIACTFTSITSTGGTGICEGQIAIGNSMLLAQHVPVTFSSSSNSMTVPLTGGTGQYVGVHGTVVSTSAGSNSNNTDLTITFSK